MSIFHFAWQFDLDHYVALLRTAATVGGRPDEVEIEKLGRRIVSALIGAAGWSYLASIGAADTTDEGSTIAALWEPGDEVLDFEDWCGIAAATSLEWAPSIRDSRLLVNCLVEAGWSSKDASRVVFGDEIVLDLGVGRATRLEGGASTTEVSLRGVLLPSGRVAVAELMRSSKDWFVDPPTEFIERTARVWRMREDSFRARVFGCWSDAVSMLTYEADFERSLRLFEV